MAEIKIPITKTVFGPEEEAAVIQPLRNGWVVQGHFVKEFEDKFAAFTGASHAAATSSCTTSLHIAVAALGLKSGDEVIVPAFTWISTANIVEYMGAKAIFCDVDLITFNIDIAQAETLITPRTVGIIPVHLFGLSVDMQPLMALAKKHGLWVLEDAACGYGARYHGQHVGTFGRAGCFSFHPRKAITTGEGGIIITNDPELDRLSRVLRDHGASRTDFDRHKNKGSFLLAEYSHLGYNFRMTDLQGAVGCVQLGRGPWILEQRTRLAQNYDEFITELDWLQAPIVPEGYIHGYQAYVTLFRPEAPTLANADELHERRNTLMFALESQGIATRQGTHAAALQNYYVQRYGLHKEQFPNAYIADRLSLTLPLYPQMTEAEQAFVCQSMKECF